MKSNFSVLPLPWWPSLFYLGYVDKYVLHKSYETHRSYLFNNEVTIGDCVTWLNLENLNPV